MADETTSRPGQEPHTDWVLAVKGHPMIFDLDNAARAWCIATGIPVDVARSYLQQSIERDERAAYIWLCLACDSVFVSTVELCPGCGHSHASVYDEDGVPIRADSERGLEILKNFYPLP